MSEAEAVHSPDLAAAEEGQLDEEARNAANVDAVDLKVLRMLSEDSRVSIRALSRSIGMSPGAIGERVERLEQRKIINGYTLDVDLSQLGLSLEVLIGVRLNARGSIEATITELSKLAGVIRVSVITGRWDLLVHMRVSGHQRLAASLLDEVWTLDDIRDTETMMVLDSHAQDPLGLR